MKEAEMVARHEKIVKLFRQCRDVAAISERMDISKSLIHTALKANGWRHRRCRKGAGWGRGEGEWIAPEEVAAEIAKGEE